MRPDLDKVDNPEKTDKLLKFRSDQMRVDDPLDGAGAERKPRLRWAESAEDALAARRAGAAPVSISIRFRYQCRYFSGININTSLVSISIRFRYQYQYGPVSISIRLTILRKARLRWAESAEDSLAARRAGAPPVSISIRFRCQCQYASGISIVSRGL